MFNGVLYDYVFAFTKSNSFLYVKKENMQQLLDLIATVLDKYDTMSNDAIDRNFKRMDKLSTKSDNFKWSRNKANKISISMLFNQVGQNDCNRDVRHVCKLQKVFINE